MTWTEVHLLILAALAGLEVFSRARPILHAPLLSATNALSGIVLLGALAATGSSVVLGPAPLGFFAAALAAFNLAGGFILTDRMLRARRTDRGSGP